MSIRPPAAQPSFSTSSPAHVPGELVSALMDGQLRGPLLAQTVHDLTRDPEALKRWDDYHLIGEAMRSPQAQGASLAVRSPDFLARLQRRLAEEKPLQATEANEASWPQAAPVPAITNVRGATAALQRVFLWQGVAAIASAAALAAVAWHLLVPATDGPHWAQSAPQQLPAAVQAQASAPAVAVPPGLEVVESTKGPMLRDAQLQELLAAHKQAAGNSALPVPAVFLRNATFEAGADASR